VKVLDNKGFEPPKVPASNAEQAEESEDTLRKKLSKKVFVNNINLWMYCVVVRMIAC